MNLLRKALVRSLPLSFRIRNLLNENRRRCRFDYEQSGWSSNSGSFLFDDGSTLRSVDVAGTGAEEFMRLARASEYFSASEMSYFETVDDSANGESRITVYWPAERTSLERWIAGARRIKPSDLLPASEPGKVQSMEADLPQEAETRVPEPAPAASPVEASQEAQQKAKPQQPTRPVLTPWNTIRYGVVGGLRGEIYRRSYLLQRSDRLCFAMMAGNRATVQQRQNGFIEFLKRKEDWPLAHQKYAEQNEGMETTSIELFADGQCRFFCAGIQAVYWSGRLKKLMRFPNTQSPLKSRLHTGDFVLLIPGGWAAKEAAELREVFLYPEEGIVEKVSALLDYAGRGKGLLIQGPEGVP